MTDKDTLKTMFVKSGIEFEEEESSLTVEAGYIGFVSVFAFDNDGNLLTVEAYEQ